MKSIWAKLKSACNRLNSDCLSGVLRAEEAALDGRALLHLEPLQNGFFPFTASAIRPFDLYKIANDVVVNRRATLLEIGAGTSTMILARLMRQTGGRLISVEHDPDWAALIQEKLKSEGLESHANVAVCPLVNINGGGGIWYDPGLVAAALEGRSIDSLVIDGPPAYQTGRERAREPAYDLLKHYLSANVAVFLDDINRPGEREIVKEYTRIMGEDFKYQQLSRTMGMWHRGHFYSI